MNTPRILKLVPPEQRKEHFCEREGCFREVVAQELEKEGWYCAVHAGVSYAQLQK